MTILPSAGLRARVALDKHSFRTTHSLGQNFLLDDRFLSGLLDKTGVHSGDRVLEIGPGAGVMTALISERAEKVCAVELDQRLEPVLRDVLQPYSNAEVVFCDFLKADVNRLLKDAFGTHEYRVIANLPYYITADILMRLVTSERPPESISIMVQKEAAERIQSEPGEKQECALAATIRIYGSAEVLEKWPPGTLRSRTARGFLLYSNPEARKPDRRVGGASDAAQDDSMRVRDAQKDAGKQSESKLRTVRHAGGGDFESM